MTEDEAKTKWCPFVRLHIEGKAPTFSVAPNRDQRGTCCIGSACMAWRKDGSRFKDGRTGHLHDRDLTGHGTWIDTGFCGLAGAPQ